MQTRIGLVVLDGFTDSGVSVALDVLRAANALARREGHAPPFVIEVLSWSGRPVRAASGLVTTVHGGLSRLEKCQVVLVPGCWAERDEDVDELLARGDVVKVVSALGRAVDRGVVIGASCTGSFLLAATGRMERRRATTTWWLAGAFRSRFPGVDLDVDQSLTIDGRLMCAGAVFAMADLALTVVSRVAGPSLARQCMRVLLLDEHPSQAPYMVLRQVVTNEPVVRSTEAWVRRHLAEGFSIGALARAVGTSPRTLARKLDAALGVSPIGFVQRIRLESASHLLETSRLSLDEVAERVGYHDAGTLRRLIRRELGRAPRELRQQSQARPNRLPPNA